VGRRDGNLKGAAKTKKTYRENLEIDRNWVYGSDCYHDFYNKKAITPPQE
jgi:hypothetical protein